MEVHKFNISRPSKYEKDGEEKTRWDNVGYLTIIKRDDGSISRIVEIPAIGLQANAFPQEEKKPQNDDQPPF